MPSMIRNGRGEMGFMESMVSFMAVVIVLGLYLVFAASSSVTALSPLDELDADMLIESTAEGPRISGSYAYLYLFNKGLKGMSVTVSVPYFQDTDGMTIGDVSGTEYSKRFLLLRGYDNGRTLPVILEVRAFA